MAGLRAMTKHLFGHIPILARRLHGLRSLALILVTLAGTAIATPARSQVPCDFKGVSVGDKLTREQLMQRLGISKFKVDPPDLSRNEIDWKEVDKYGITGVAERQDDKTGPYCRENSCNIPFGIFVGDDKFPVKVFVALKEGLIYAIEVSFNSIFWNDVWGIIVKKYGPAWDIERDAMGVMDYETKKIDQFERVIVTHKFGGTNPQTKDTCSLSATNIDIIFRHHDSLGTLHAIFAIKREPKDF
jgi:hypothetical protein